MEPYTVSELSYSLLTICGAISGVLLVCWKSRCKTINCGWGCIQCDRLVDETPYIPPSSTIQDVETRL